MFWPFFGTELGIVAILATAFWVWMLIDCIRNEPQSVWIWVILFLGWLGGLIYFVGRKLPNMRAPGAATAGLRERIRDLEEQVRHLKNPYYLTQLGQAYLDAGKTGRALEPFEEALKLDRENLAALVGAGECRVGLGKFEAALEPLDLAYGKDPNYRMGRGAELLAICCLELGRDEKLQEIEPSLPKKAHLTEYVRAYLQARRGNREEARQMLSRLIEDVRHLPRAYYRKDRIWMQKARALLRQL
jgi:hypothetical protein